MSVTAAGGPLKTPFVQPSFCTSAVQFELGVTCNGAGNWDRASACFPNSQPSQIYSPAIACPVGWTADTTSLGTITCCPSSFTAGVESCRSATTLSPGYNDVYTCVGSSLSSSFLTPVPAGSNLISTFVWAVQVRLIVDPADTFTTFTGSISSAIASSSASPASSTSVTTPTGAPTTPDSDPGPKKLSGGAIAGIVIGVLALFLLLAGAIFFFLRRKKQRANHDTSASGPHNGGDLPEFVASGPQPYTNSAAHHSHTKIPPVTTEKTNTPSLRTAATPIPTTPTQTHTDTAELFFPTHTHNRTSDISELASPQHHHQSNRDTYTTTSSATYPRSPLSELASSESPRESTLNHNVSNGQEPMSHVARLEAEKATLEERIARMRQLAQMEEEQAGMRAEIMRLRGR